MKKLLDLLSEGFEKAFVECGYEEKYGKVTISNRPDLCEFQCNGAMAAAKAYKKAPFIIAGEIVEKMNGCEMFEEITAVNPGFINLKVAKSFIAGYVKEMSLDELLGCELNEKPKTIVVDYGGPNVAKPLHVGHLRPAIIGETLKRLYRFKGDNVIGDVHLGDWGMPIGLIIEELRTRKPELVYFKEGFTEDMAEAEAPFTIAELEEIYPTASAKSKEDAEFRNRAEQNTFDLQNGNVAYRALWKHILNVSVTDLKENYKKLNVEFDLWKGESDAYEFVDEMVEKMIADGFAYESQGAMVVDISEEGDTKEIPPCIVKKSNGASLYSTTDLATLVQRERDYHPDEVVYVVDKRQDMHFTQVFRTAKKTGIVPESTKLTYRGFGTMNGKDGKPFKTRDGGVMRLENLIGSICDAVYEKIKEGREVSDEEARKTSQIVGLAALKYGDLSNQASKDYIFDIDRFASFEGNTGPYILYTIVRIKSILNKFYDTKMDVTTQDMNAEAGEAEKALMLEVAKYNAVIDNAYEESAPHKLCAYIYDLSNAFNKFYHETSIMGEEDETKQSGYINLLNVVKSILETSIYILGFDAPEKM